MPRRDWGAVSRKQIVEDVVCHANGLGLCSPFPSPGKEALCWMSPELHDNKRALDFVLLRQRKSVIREERMDIELVLGESGNRV